MHSVLPFVLGAALLPGPEEVVRQEPIIVVAVASRVSEPLADTPWSKGDDLDKAVPLNSVDPPKAVAGLAWRSAKYWLWSDVRGLTNLAAGFDRYTQPGRNASLTVKIVF